MAAKKSTVAKARERLQEASERAEAEVIAAAEVRPERSGAAYREVPLAAVAPNAVNVREDLGDLSELTASIRAVGVLQPLVVRPLAEGERGAYPEGTRYVAVMGNRRRAAGAAAGLTLVPVVVRTDLDATNQRRSMLVENLQRQDLTPMEEARAFQAELDTGLSQHKLAELLGLTQAHVSRRVSLLRLDPALQGLVAAGQVGVDLAVNDLGRLSLADQQRVGEQLAQADADADAGPAALDPSWVREVIEETARAEKAAQAQARQRERAEAAGATVLDWSEARAQLGDSLWRRRLDDPQEIEAAAAAGELAATLDRYGDDPQFYTTGKLRRSEQADDPEARQRREWKARRDAVGAWVGHHSTPPRAEFVAALQRHLVETMPQETGSVVHRWLQGKVGAADAEEYYAWQRSLTEADYPTVAWHLTVAADLMATRYGVGGGPAGQRTAARIEEVGERA